MANVILYFIHMHRIILIAHNLRSSHNVGSILRTADGLGVNEVYLTGYSPYPLVNNDSRMPHVAKKVDAQIAKTALGTERSVKVIQSDDIYPIIKSLKKKGYLICALEQSSESINIPAFKAPDRIALIVGREVEGIESEVLKIVDKIIQIPMLGKKESFNVSVAAAMALYALRYNN